MPDDERPRLGRATQTPAAGFSETRTDQSTSEDIAPELLIRRRDSPIRVFSGPRSESRELEIANPAAWQMPVRLYLESLSVPEVESWAEGFRLMYNVVMRITRDRVNRGVTQYCFVCERPFPDGRPAGEAQYLDADRQWIKVFCHHANEYPQLLQKALAKEQALRRGEEIAEEAARKALVEMRKAHRPVS